MPRPRLVYADRLAELTPRQLVGQVRYGQHDWAPWERTPDVIARWTMLDPNLSIPSARAIAAIVATAYAEMTMPAGGGTDG